MNKDEDKYYIKEAIGAACFHGETWYRCPYCDTSFEYFDAVFGRNGIIPQDNRNYICGNCRKVFHIS